MGDYWRPKSVEEAVAWLNQGAVTIVAGGTDVFPARKGARLEDHVQQVFVELPGVEPGHRLKLLNRKQVTGRGKSRRLQKRAEVLNQSSQVSPQIVARRLVQRQGTFCRQQRHDGR